MHKDLILLLGLAALVAAPSGTRACCGNPCDNSVSIDSLSASPEAFNPDWGETTLISFSISANNSQTIVYTLSCAGVPVCTGSGVSSVSGSCSWDGAGQPFGTHTCTLSATTSGGTRPECPPAADSQSVQVTLIPVRVMAILFNYGSALTVLDGITIQKDKTIIRAPEWTYWGINEPGAYTLYYPTLNGTVLGNRTMQVVFNTSRPGSYDIAASSSGNLPDVVSRTVSLSGGLSSPITFELLASSFPGGLDILTGNWQWEISGGPMGLPPTDINKTGQHKLYFTLAPGLEPLDVPWTEVLDYTCSWAVGESDPVAVGAELTDRYYNTLSIDYDPGIIGWGSRFDYDLTSFLAYVASPTGHAGACDDSAHMVVSFGTAVGIPLVAAEVTSMNPGWEINCKGIREPILIKTNYLEPVGAPGPANDYGDTNKAWDAEKECGFRYHVTGVLSSSFPLSFGEKDPTFDASLRLDNQAEPVDADSPPYNWLLVDGGINYGQKTNPTTLGPWGWLSLFTDDRPNPADPFASVVAGFRVF